MKSNGGSGVRTLVGGSLPMSKYRTLLNDVMVLKEAPQRYEKANRIESTTKDCAEREPGGESGLPPICKQLT